MISKVDARDCSKSFDNPKLSLIICTYGECNLSRDLLKSIGEQSFKDFELIVIDNNKIQKIDNINDIDCKIIHEENRGLSFARNKGIEFSVGEFLMFIDSDVILDKDCLENLLNGANTYNSDLVGARVLLRNDIRHNLTKKERRFLSELIYEGDIESIYFPKYIVGACMMFRRSTVMKYGLFLTSLGRKGTNLLSGEETEFMKRIIKYGGKVSYINSAICTHNINLDRTKFRYLFRRAFWQGVTDHLIDELFNETANRKYKIIESNYRNIILNISRFIGYKLY